MEVFECKAWWQLFRQGSNGFGGMVSQGAKLSRERIQLGVGWGAGALAPNCCEISAATQKNLAFRNWVAWLNCWVRSSHLVGHLLPSIFESGTNLAISTTSIDFCLMIISWFWCKYMAPNCDNIIQHVQTISQWPCFAPSHEAFTCT